MAISRQERASGVIFKVAVPTGMNMSNMRASRRTPVLASGWLQKMKRKGSGGGTSVLSTNWNRRWVTIENDSLLWRHSKENEVAGSIRLEHMSSVYKMKSLRSSSSKGGGGGSVFIVKSRKRNLCLMAKDDADCDRWVRAIQLQLDLREGGTASGPASSKNRRKSNGGGDKFELMIQAADESFSSLVEMNSCSKLQHPCLDAENDENYGTPAFDALLPVTRASFSRDQIGMERR